jgi:hypothetical protein
LSSAKKKKKLQTKSDRVRPAVDEVAEVSVQDLHIFHSLVFQFKDKIAAALTKEEDKNEFYRVLDKLGSYDKKTSFSFLGDAEQRTCQPSPLLDSPAFS